MTFLGFARVVSLFSFLVTIWLLPFRASAEVPIRIGQNFIGSRFGVDSDSVPADSNGAAGPQHFVELINGRFSVYNKSDGTRVQTMTDLQFWRAAGLSFASTVAVTDPRLIYDTYSQRWFASMVDFTVNSPGTRNNRFLIAVSATADPTGAWHALAFSTDPSRTTFADYPTMGLDQNAVYLSGDMFDFVGNEVAPALVSIPKSSLLADTPSVSGRTTFTNLTYSARGNILQPAVTVGAPTTSGSVLAVGDLGIDFEPHNTLVLSRVFDSGTNTIKLISPAATISVPSYTVPINPPQPDQTDSLDNGDARLAAAVRRVGDVIFATHAVEMNDRAAVRWYRINATNETLIESGTISDPELDLFFPSIAANEAGTVVIACNGSSASTFVSSYAVAGEVVNGALTFGPLTLLKAGSTSYHNADLTGVSRWGDYSATTVDPARPNRFWTIQMVPRTATAWATQITEIITGTEVTVTRSGDNLVVSWAVTADAYQLQHSESLAPSAQWTNVTATPSVADGVNTVILPATGDIGFFRLIKPLSAP